MWRSESEEELDLFQLEVVSDKVVYVCNICDKGFDSEAKVKGHLKETHNKVLEFNEGGNVWILKMCPACQRWRLSNWDRMCQIKIVLNNQLLKPDIRRAFF